MAQDDKKSEGNGMEYDRDRELRAFDESKAGVKGLVDSGIEKVPPIFNCAKFGFNKDSSDGHSQVSIPVIDFEGIHRDPARRSEIVRAVRDASERRGFFQVLNHGIPATLLDGMMEGVRRFHEQDTEVKREFYTRDMSKKVQYISNFDLYKSPAANWRDTFSLVMEPDLPAREELPEVCRDVVVEYSKHVKQLGLTLFELMSEALGLKPSYFEERDYAKLQLMLGHYYPPCPEPELTVGTTSHSDSDLLTILLQDTIGGLQVLNQNQWVDVLPLPGALIVNLGDLLQVLSNDRFISVEHRVLSKREGPRISVASFFRPQGITASRAYEPIPELISKDNPPAYRNFHFKEYMDYYLGKGLDGTSALAPFRL